MIDKRLFIQRLAERLGRREDAILFVAWLRANVPPAKLLALYEKVMEEDDAAIVREREHVHAARPLAGETDVVDWDDEWWPDDSAEPEE